MQIFFDMYICLYLYVTYMFLYLPVDSDTDIYIYTHTYARKQAAPGTLDCVPAASPQFLNAETAQVEAERTALHAEFDVERAALRKAPQPCTLSHAEWTRTRTGWARTLETLTSKSVSKRLRDTEDFYKPSGSRD